MPITKDVKDLGSLFGATSPERAVMIASLTSSAAIASEDRDAAWRKVIRKIRGMLALSDDWDGMGANAPSSDLIFYAMKLAEAIRQKDELPAPTRVAATPVGTIGME